MSQNDSTNGQNDQADTKNPTIFVISPIGKTGSEHRKHADLLFNAIICPVLKELGMTQPERADRFAKAGMITDQILSKLVEADIVIADLSYANPNVFYELGVRHKALLPAIHMAKEDTELPFDNMGHRTIFFDLGDWESQERARSELKGQVLSIVEPGYSVSNPVQQAEAYKQAQASGSVEDQMLVDIQQRLKKLERDGIKNSQRITGSVESYIEGDSIYIDRMSLNDRQDGAFRFITGQGDKFGNVNASIVFDELIEAQFPANVIDSIAKIIGSEPEAVVKKAGRYFKIYALDIPF